jgi:hypothetical protein
LIVDHVVPMLVALRGLCCDGDALIRTLLMLHSNAQPRCHPTLQMLTPNVVYHGLFADLVVGNLLPLGDDHGLEILALVHLRLDLCDQLGQIWCVLVMC